MEKIRIWFMDWWRGYTDSDLIAVRVKMAAPHFPGGIVPVTKRELAAWISWCSHV